MGRASSTPLRAKLRGRGQLPVQRQGAVLRHRCQRTAGRKDGCHHHRSTPPGTTRAHLAKPDLPPPSATSDLITKGPALTSGALHAIVSSWVPGVIGQHCLQAKGSRASGRQWQVCPTPYSVHSATSRQQHTT
mmetsp:Transcript_14155/g.22550  ORF Transcript_14155/g.22550 Transcript_14155/m.22550 type:complete len:133 (+) Transcript_14155:1685-2083(+)